MTKLDKKICFIFVESDEDAYKKLETHLSRYLQNQDITSVKVLKINPDNEIDIDNSCNIFIILISAEMLSSSFMRSEYWQNIYLWHRDNIALVLPILVEPCDIAADNYLSKIPILPSNKKAILSNNWSSSAEGYASAAKGIRLAIEKYNGKTSKFNFNFRLFFSKINIRPYFNSFERSIRSLIITLLCLVLGREIYLYTRSYIIIKTLEFQMVDIKGTPNFETGNANGNYNEKFLHNVSISDFAIGQYEITRKQWLTVMGQDSTIEIPKDGCDDCPITNVAYYDIEVFLKRLHDKTGKYYRLPTEAEWEYVAKEMGDNNTFYSNALANKNIDEIAWYYNNSNGKVHAEKKQPNKLKIYNLLGNVEEWCGGRYFYEDDNPTLNHQTYSGIVRGGCCFSDKEHISTTYRKKMMLGAFNETTGFRIALTKGF